MQDFVPALIIAKSGRIRDGLSALLAAIPEIGVVGQTEDGGMAIKLLPNSYPALVLLDAGLPDGMAWQTLRQIKAQRPQTRCIVLADNRFQQRLAQAAQADEVLLTGFSIHKFFRSVELLLSSNGDSSPRFERSTV